MVLNEVFEIVGHLLYVKVSLLQKMDHCHYRILPNYRTYPYKHTVKQF